MAKVIEKFEIKGQKLVKYTGNDKHIIIPAKIRAIDCHAFAIGKNYPYKYNETIESIQVPYGTYEIYNFAFAGCVSLKELTLPTGVERFGIGAICDCFSLESIHLPHTLMFIGFVNMDFRATYEYKENAFLVRDRTYLSPNYKPALKSITVDERSPYYCDIDGVLFNKDKTHLIAYPQGRNEKTYTVPDGVINIGYEAFQGCKMLNSIILPDSVTNIGERAFNSCSSLKEVNLNMVEYVDRSAFEQCDSLRIVNLSENTKKIGDYAFSGCGSLKTVSIPDSVIDIDGDAFDDCESLTIKCHKDSYAHKYAVNNNINFELV